MYHDQNFMNFNLLDRCFKKTACQLSRVIYTATPAYILLQSIISFYDYYIFKISLLC